MDTLRLFYRHSAEDSAYGWEHESLPIGNGYLGASIFGIVQRERIQITENSLVNDYSTGGLNNFAEVYLHFDHTDVKEYERGLVLDTATAYVQYTWKDVLYKREYFASYPDRVMVIRLSSSKPQALDFSFTAEIPYIKDYGISPGDGGGKTGSITFGQDGITLQGRMNLYQTQFEGQIKILSTDGVIISQKDKITIERATEAVLLVGVATNYHLSPEVFLEEDPKKKLKPGNPHEKVSAMINNASRDYESLMVAHLEDYQSLFGRVRLNLNDGEGAGLPTDELLKQYQTKNIPYLEMLYFQYGRYLLISSSRKGCLPANLQGIWNCHDASPWGSGYWHNINVQMNYWPAFHTNLMETFEAYKDFFGAFLPKAQKYADDYIRKNNPSQAGKDGENGWTIGTAAYPYTISAPGGHSGPGTGGLTSKLFWEYYDFTRDRDKLEKVTYPVLLGMAEFLTKTVKRYDDLYLTTPSASPEQMVNGGYVAKGSYYQTVGCAFDQQMIFENARDFIKAGEILGKEENRLLEIQKEQLSHYDPVAVGWSGQIKEYREEKFYGEIGEYRHRHISQLMGLYPGTSINSHTDAWMQAARYTLNERGDESTGWALAHRLNARARTGDGNRCYTLLRELLQHRTNDNLWDFHPPFQIDGNFGATAGIGEMLLQSHNGMIDILPALPDAWDRGEVKGLLARGAFEVSICWENHGAKCIRVLSKKGGELKLAYQNISLARLTNPGKHFDILGRDEVCIQTEPMKEYEFVITTPFVKVQEPSDLAVCGNTLMWKGKEKASYSVYRASDNDSLFTRIAENIKDFFYTDDFDFRNHETVTYMVTACENGFESKGVSCTLNHATELQKDIYRNQLKGRNQNPN